MTRKTHHCKRCNGQAIQLCLQRGHLAIREECVGDNQWFDTFWGCSNYPYQEFNQRYKNIRRTEHEYVKPQQPVSQEEPVDAQDHIALSKLRGFFKEMNSRRLEQKVYAFTKEFSSHTVHFTSMEDAKKEEDKVIMANGTSRNKLSRQGQIDKEKDDRPKNLAGKLKFLANKLSRRPRGFGRK